MNLPEIQDINTIAAGAASKILDVYNTEFDVEDKQDKTPLTQADLASHEHIVECLHDLTPDIPILSEESASIPYETRRNWNRYWLVDPLDGTREFIKRNGEFTVNIALIEDGIPVMGVVQVPVSGTLYFASAGKAWKQDENGQPQPLNAASHKQTPLRVVGSRSHRGESLNRFLDKVGDHEMVPMGSSLKICLVADNKADIYPRLGPTSEWDTAAAQAVVEGAGGYLTDCNMQPLRYNTKADLLNPHFLVFADNQTDWQNYLE